jgi:hypothetical protein
MSYLSIMFVSLLLGEPIRITINEKKEKKKEKGKEFLKIIHLCKFVCFFFLSTLNISGVVELSAGSLTSILSKKLN